MAADPVGFLDDGVHAQLGDLVDESVLVSLSVLQHCEHKGNAGEKAVRVKVGHSDTFFFTKVLPAFVLVDVHVDLLDSLQGLGQLRPVMVALRRGPQQLHQQQRVTHHPLHWLDKERAQVDVVRLTPERDDRKCDKSDLDQRHTFTVFSFT